MFVLLLTHSRDFFTIDRVAQALERRGARTFRFDTDLYPTRCTLSAKLGPTGFERVLESAGTSVPLKEIDAVWYRRIWPSQLPEGLNPKWTGYARTLAHATLSENLRALEQAFWVNDPEAEQRAEAKTRQLEVARRIGFDVPPTLVTNSPTEALAFFEDVRARGRRVVTKLLRPLTQSMDGSGDAMPTRELTEEHLSELEGLRWAPQIFQELVPKRKELRVVATRQAIFAGSIESAKSDQGQMDWRQIRPGESVTWQQEALSPEISTKVHDLLRVLGLEFGALDLILPPDGEPVFLEINPGGEWGWLEKDLDLPISQAIADSLLQGATGR